MTTPVNRRRGAARAAWVVVVAAALVLVVGLVSLFHARFERGDVYPHYSSLRSDPLGTSLLFAGYRAAGVETGRRFQEIHRTPMPDGTCFVLGTTWGQLDVAGEKDWASLLGMVDAGGRLVIGLTGRQSFLQRIVEEAERASREKQQKGSSDDEKDRDAVKRTDESAEKEVSNEEPAEPAEAEPTSAPDETSEEPEADRGKTASDPNDRGTPVLRLLGLSEGAVLALGKEGDDEAVTFAVRQPAANERLPVRLAWHERVTLETDTSEWRIVYAVDKRPVVIERSWGKGTIAVLASSYLVSNEAMVVSREPEVLVWLLGGKKRAIFDETHLGVTENRGIAVLARRYGLTHAAFVVLAVVLLYVWRSRSSLLPKRLVDEEAGAQMSGRDAAAGLINLLRRTIRAATLFESCMAEFKNSAAWRRLAPERRKRLETLAGADGGDPVQRVRAAHEILSNPS